MHSSPQERDSFSDLPVCEYLIHTTLACVTLKVIIFVGRIKIVGATNPLNFNCCKILDVEDQIYKSQQLFMILK